MFASATCVNKMSRLFHQNRSFSLFRASWGGKLAGRATHGYGKCFPHHFPAGNKRIKNCDSVNYHQTGNLYTHDTESPMVADHVYRPISTTTIPPTSKICPGITYITTHRIPVRHLDYISIFMKLTALLQNRQNWH
jgi:hypothetical protein